MKRGKDGDKVTVPMFPRLSVNDAEKGGPRAPPRNKMALYEQLCTPAQRFNGGGRFLSTPGMKPSNSMPPISSKQVSGYGNNQYTPLHVPPSMPTSHTETERPEIQSSRGMNLISFPQVELEQRQNVGDEDDYTVPTYLRSDTYVHAPNRGNSRAAKSGTRSTYSDHLTQNMTATNVNLEHNNPPISNRDDRRNQAQKPLKEIKSSRSDSVKYDISKESREMIDMQLKPASGSSPRGFRDLLPKGGDRLHASNPCIQQKFVTTLLDNEAPNSANIEEFSRDINHGDVSNQRSVCNSQVDRTVSHQPVLDNEYQGRHRGNPTMIENAENCDEMSETSMVDSMSGLDITPDDVVGIIGYKHFLKARKAISNQQRVFSVQVFELHRLIQVQRLIAGSPQIMVDDNAYVGTAVKEPPPTKVPQLDYAVKPPVHSIKPKSHSEKPNRDAECTADNAVKTVGRSGTQLPNHGPFTGNVPPPTPSSSDPRTAPWCFPQPSGHQWLVPVMSPSEGLIYKPYPGPGFMSPASGGFGPMGGIPDPAAPFAQGGFMNPPYGGFPTPYFPPYSPHPQWVGVEPGQNYFPPFSMPSGNPALSSSAVDQMHHQFPGPGVHGQKGLQSASGASNPDQLPNQSSCNLQKQSSEAASQAQKIRQPKDKVLQGSTASSPLQRPQPRRGVTPVEAASSVETRNPLPLFPASTDEASPPSRTVSEMPKVIKVVPHNAKSATESAVRIFQSIQRERKHQDTS